MLEKNNKKYTIKTKNQLSIKKINKNIYKKFGFLKFYLYICNTSNVNHFKF